MDIIWDSELDAADKKTTRSMTATLLNEPKLFQLCRECIPEQMLQYKSRQYLFLDHSSGAVLESRWPSWAGRSNEPSGFCGRKELLNRASALVTTCPLLYVNWHLRTLNNTSSSCSWMCGHSGWCLIIRFSMWIFSETKMHNCFQWSEISLFLRSSTYLQVEHDNASSTLVQTISGDHASVSHFSEAILHPKRWCF